MDEVGDDPAPELVAVAPHELVHGRVRVDDPALRSISTIPVSAPANVASKRARASICSRFASNSAAWAMAAESTTDSASIVVMSRSPKAAGSRP